MNFKDQILADLDLFINLEEFADLHIIDGVEMQIILDSDKLKARQAKSEVYEGDLLFHARKSSFEAVPAVGQIMRFDGEVYRVSDIQDDDGLLSITLVGNMS